MPALTITRVTTLLYASRCIPAPDSESHLMTGVIASDLMSDVLMREGDGALLLSSLTSVQTIRTAHIIGIPMVCIVNNKSFDTAMENSARQLQITLLSSPLSVFEACCILGKELDR